MTHRADAMSATRTAREEARRAMEEVEGLRVLLAAGELEVAEAKRKEEDLRREIQDFCEIVKRSEEQLSEAKGEAKRIEEAFEEFRTISAAREEAARSEAARADGLLQMVKVSAAAREGELLAGVERLRAEIAALRGGGTTLEMREAVAACLNGAVFEEVAARDRVLRKVAAELSSAIPALGGAMAALCSDVVDADALIRVMGGVTDDLAAAAALCEDSARRGGLADRSALERAVRGVGGVEEDGMAAALKSFGERVVKAREATERVAGEGAAEVARLRARVRELEGREEELLREVGGGEGAVADGCVAGDQMMAM